MDRSPKQHLLSWPRTQVGWWATGLGLATLLLPLLNNLVTVLVTIPSGGTQTAVNAFGTWTLACGLASGVIGLIALVRSHERSILTWVAILIGFLALLMIVHEFIPLQI